jgi:hypothetical protein
MPSRPRLARLSEDGGAILVGVVAQHDAEPAPAGASPAWPVAAVSAFPP